MCLPASYSGILEVNQKQPTVLIVFGVDQLCCAAMADLFRSFFEILDPSARVLAIGLTENQDAIHESLRQSNGFLHEIIMTAPNCEQRERILRQIGVNEDIECMVRLTNGLIAEDFVNLQNEVVKVARDRHQKSEQQPQQSSSNDDEAEMGLMNKMEITQDDWENAVALIRPPAENNVRFSFC